ncbi:ankyrin repeat domain-containing protein [Oscillatoria salina]|uniref:ankyrin repeat domain-containing protein n=1 Tax=Oscillatoria salina TaxID=331517 RepID=UPI0013B8787D|nr:ankyrin repeat domain-containing protein [Oscillatoria salina]MBZ8179093.1 hypothetical protein [Oscillatoria salina IIICB1]MEC4983313.1 ankyrin repeat domain-containing protein [Oscillatoria sp. PMC 1076.18]MEC4987706.1 ankyrin repeat domain-containing protein [Oscillatoria sp. PMC 1068.18]NET90614.1 hypothetical protein [Kamptonema sp. SIO1D9]
MFNAKDFKTYWKECLFALYILIGVFRVHSEEDLFWFGLTILVIHLILSELKSARGIHKAVLNENVEAIIKYLDNGTDIDLEDNQGATPLMLTVQHNFLNLAELLINRGANVNYNLEDKDKVSPLYTAVIRKHNEIANLLLARGAVFDPHSATFFGKIEVIQDYLEQGGNVNLLGYRDVTLLQMAAWNNQLEIAQLLIDSGAEVNDQDKYGRTPLHFAASNSDADKLVEFLIERGAELNVVARGNLIFDGDGKTRHGTPLHIAVGYNCLNIAEILINQGADVNARCNDLGGDTPLHDAVSGRIARFDVVELLIANGADVNAYEKFQGKTPLHEVAYWGHIDIAELLIVNGAKVNSRDFSGYTPLSSAETGRHNDMYCFLVRCGGKL